ncbi:MAG: hypothetical protein R3362_03765, partial [Rhodothermales bacterium]|nr:hypothetical protein [Rhodothermales bacterium]
MLRRYRLLRLLLLFGGLTALPLWSGCDTTEESGETTFTGFVQAPDPVDPTTLLPVAGATVTVTETGATDLTDADGEFRIDVEADSSGQVFTLVVAASGFAERTLRPEAEVDEVVRLGDVILSTSDGSGGGPVGPSG